MSEKEGIKTVRELAVEIASIKEFENDNEHLVKITKAIFNHFKPLFNYGYLMRKWHIEYSKSGDAKDKEKFDEYATEFAFVLLFLKEENENLKSL